MAKRVSATKAQERGVQGEVLRLSPRERKDQGEGVSPAPLFPIVAIGASAGGLEALQQFFAHVPADCVMAFVVIQHLDPDHKGIMPELLQRATTMPVAQAKDRMKVRPNGVYVIPPNRDLSILRGALHLLDPVSPRGLRLPIDFFFRALADDRHEYAIGVILSGMGSDGSLGLRAIKEQCGLVLVQDPATAKFDGMPCSAVNTGLVDFIAPVEEIPQRILDTPKHGPTPQFSPVAPEMETTADKSGLDKVCILLRARTGHDFSSYKKNTLYRRIERRMAIHQLNRIDHYVRFLRETPQEVDLLFKELLIGVTSFFRDPAAWQVLRDEVLSKLLAENRAGGALRAWVVGCSTGEEAYSLAMVFREAQERSTSSVCHTLQIFATDLDSDAIDKARQATYPSNIAADISAERLARFFVEEDSGFRVSNEIREMVVFAPQNLLSDPPFTRLDLLTCRNLLIYLGAEIQNKMLPLFHYSLKPGGVDLEVHPISEPAALRGMAMVVFTDVAAPPPPVVSGKGKGASGRSPRTVVLEQALEHAQLEMKALREEMQNVIDGVVITFTDISTAKKLEAKLRELAGKGGTSQ